MALHKSYGAHFKTLDDAAGTFAAVVSVFGNVDLIGDRVMKGAFTKSLEKWAKSGDPIPIIWSHQWEDPAAHIGYVDASDVMETKQGLEIQRGVLDVDTNPFAAQVYRLMKAKRVKEFSFAYDVVQEHKAKDGANDLLQLDLIEAGPTLKGMNPATELISVKSGRVLSGENESTIREAVTQLLSVLAKLDSAEAAVEAKANEPREANAEAKANEPERANAEARQGSVPLWEAELQALTA